MHLTKTQEHSQFYRFHSNSEVANKVLTNKSPTLEDRPISVLQVASTGTNIYDTIIEFVYLDI